MKNSHPRFWSTPTGWTALAIIAAATYFLIFEHGHDHEHSPDSENRRQSFQELSDKNAAYRDGYIEGVEEGRKEMHKKDDGDE